MMTDKFNQIAREGLLMDHAKRMGIELSPAEERAMIIMDRNLFRLIKEKLPLIRQPSMNEIKEATIQATIEAFKETASQLRSEGDWEAFGSINWVAGAQGFRL